MGLSSCIILLGSGLVYTYSGLTNLELISTLSSIYSNSVYNPDFLFEMFSFVEPGDTGKLVANTPWGRFGVGGAAGTLNNEKLKGISIGFLLIFSGFLFKIAASPFHNWAPDVYDDSPT